MKKILLTIATAAISFISISQESTIKAFYKGYDSEFNIYLFEDADENTIEFIEVAPAVSSEFKLKTDDLIDKAYQVTYSVTEKEDEDGFVFEENKIIKLTETKLQYNSSFDDEELDED